MTKRVALYARYSSDLQRDQSIEDQFRLCENKAQAQAWKIVGRYCDAGLSGASLMRPGLQELIQSVMRGECDIVVAEALDRLSRDLEDVAGFFKQMEFAGVRLVTLSEGDITTMHIGLKGTMNELYLKDLADKTRRGLRGRVENGKSGGGLAYGYHVVNNIGANGEPIKGEREIDEAQAAIIRRIFEAYAYGNQSPRAIANALNTEGVPCPSGKAWGQSTINGNRKRGTGILNNELYIGQLIWNRQRFIKDPATGKRVTRLNDESQWVRQNLPELQIVPQALWEAAKARQKALDRSGALHKNNRPQYLLSGLLTCGICGGGFSKINAERYGCSNARNKGESVCDNKKTIKKDTLEKTVLEALQSQLMRPELIDVFCDEYTKTMNALNAKKSQTLKSLKSEQTKLLKEKENVIQAIKDGIPADLVKDDLMRVSTRLEELETLLSAKPVNEPLLHPSLSGRYRKAIKELRTSLSSTDTHAQAKEHIRALIERITLTPAQDQEDLQIDLHGSLAGILDLATKGDAMKSKRLNEKRLVKTIANDNQIYEPSIIELVAGAGFEPTTFGL